MDQRKLTFIVSVCIVVAISANYCKGAEKATRPNIIFFLVDDLGWADVGYNGATNHLTPNYRRVLE